MPPTYHFAMRKESGDRIQLYLKKQTQGPPVVNFDRETRGTEFWPLIGACGLISQDSNNTMLPLRISKLVCKNQNPSSAAASSGSMDRGAVPGLLVLSLHCPVGPPIAISSGTVGQLSPAKIGGDPTEHFPICKVRRPKNVVTYSELT